VATATQRAISSPARHSDAPKLALTAATPKIAGIAQPPKSMPDLR
jgi:hypothetical protein